MNIKDYGITIIIFIIIVSCSVLLLTEPVGMMSYSVNYEATDRSMLIKMIKEQHYINEEDILMHVNTNDKFIYTVEELDLLSIKLMK